MKYKFNLSYMENDKYIPIDLKKIKGTDVFDMKKIKSIDYFTTSFNNLDEVLLYLKQNSLIPENVDKLYITYDKKVAGKVFQEIYYYGEKLFYKKNIEQLKTSYSYSLIKNRTNHGKFIMYIVEHYRKIYKHRTFGNLYNLANSISKYGYHFLTPSEKSEYNEEVDKFLNYIFTKKTKDGVQPAYRNIRDFICFMGKEKLIHNYNKDITSNEVENESLELENENIIYNEYKKHNISFVDELSEDSFFESYKDGYDYITSSTTEELVSDFNEYGKKLCIKRDNGEYE